MNILNSDITNDSDIFVEENADGYVVIACREGSEDNIGFDRLFATDKVFFGGVEATFEDSEDGEREDEAYGDMEKVVRFTFKLAEADRVPELAE